jgi:c-di-GMP-binding flagellar brake protein YcgR
MINPNIDLCTERCIERRKYPRYDYPATVDYVVDNDAAAKPHKAVLRNICTGGMGAYIIEPLHVGQKIVIKSNLSAACRAGIVRWIKQENNGLFEVGFRFEACSALDAT